MMIYRCWRPFRPVPGSHAPRFLSPFDNLICIRRRTEQIFNFYYRIEIYVPAAKRQYGYYVLPILHGDRLIGRINPKFDRKTGVFHIHNVYIEPNVPRNAEIIGAVRSTIRDLAAFIGATSIAWGNIPWGWAKLKR
jgi:uncharacterized protein YcaQ